MDSHQPRGENPKMIWVTINTLRSKPESPNHKAVYTINGQVMNTATTAYTLNKHFSDIGGNPTDIDIDRLLEQLPKQSIEVVPGQVEVGHNDIDASKSTCLADFPSWVTKSCSVDLRLLIFQNHKSLFFFLYFSFCLTKI